MKNSWENLQEIALTEIETTIEELPSPLKERAIQLPITFERAPNEGLQDSGIESNTLGLFIGADMADDGENVLPPQIMLFLENIWKYAEEDEKRFCDEICTTFLHELGHYFGLGEDDLTERGLE